MSERRITRFGQVVGVGVAATLAGGLIFRACSADGGNPAHHDATPSSPPAATALPHPKPTPTAPGRKPTGPATQSATNTHFNFTPRLFTALGATEAKTVDTLLHGGTSVMPLSAFIYAHASGNEANTLQKASMRAAGGETARNQALASCASILGDKAVQETVPPADLGIVVSDLYAMDHLPAGTQLSSNDFAGMGAQECNRDIAEATLAPNGPQIPFVTGLRQP